MSSQHGQPQTANTEEIAGEIRPYIQKLTGLPSVGDDQPLISGRVLDSIAAVQIVDFIERSFRIEIADEDLELANFDTVSGLVSLVARSLERT